MRPSAGHDLWRFTDSEQFGETLVGSAQVAPLPSETVIYKAVYVAGHEVAALHQVRHRLNTAAVYLLRLVSSSDGPPFRSVLIYTPAGAEEVRRPYDPRHSGSDPPGCRHRRSMRIATARFVPTVATPGRTTS